MYPFDDKFKNLTIDDLHGIIAERVVKETERLFQRYFDTLPRQYNEAGSSTTTTLGPIIHRQVEDMCFSYSRLRNHTRDQCQNCSEKEMADSDSSTSLSTSLTAHRYK